MQGSIKAVKALKSTSGGRLSSIPVHVMEQTVGSFLLEKATNMHNWLKSELLTWNAKVTLTELSATALAAKLMEHRQLVFNRDWAGLSRQANTAGLVDLTEMLEAVRTRHDLHDKFWRYLELFVEIMSAN